VLVVIDLNRRVDSQGDRDFFVASAFPVNHQGDVLLWLNLAGAGGHWVLRPFGLDPEVTPELRATIEATLPRTSDVTPTALDRNH